MDAVLSSVHCCCVDILRGVEGRVHVRVPSLTVVVAGEGYGTCDCVVKTFSGLLVGVGVARGVGTGAV